MIYRILTPRRSITNFRREGELTLNKLQSIIKIQQNISCKYVFDKKYIIGNGLKAKAVSFRLADLLLSSYH